MRALILVTTSCFALVALAACNGGAHKAHIAHASPNGTADGPQTGTSGEMGKPGNDSDGKPVSGCLNLLKVVSTLTKKSETQYTVYTSNMDLGDLTVTPGATTSCLKFVAETDTVPKAAVFLQKSSETGPAIATRYPEDILASPEVGQMLQINGQKECASVQFKNAANPSSAISLDVVCKDEKGITLKSDKGSYIQYARGNNSLTITYYTPVTVPTNCENTNPKTAYMSKVVREISLSPGDRNTMDSKFGELINRYVAIAPPELADAIGPRNPNGSQGSSKTGTATTIDLSYRTLDNVFQQFDEGRNQLKCSPVP